MEYFFKNIIQTLILSILLGFISISLNAQAPDFTGLKVMINPGHGGNDSDDRGMPNGFWESESNLTKGLWLRDILEARGCEVIMSRVLNRTEDDLPLSQIAQMANDNNVDLFISIHSNAGNQISNYPMPIFNGTTEDPSIPESKNFAIILWEHLITNEATYWTNTQPKYIGDLTLNPTWSYGYGVLYPLVVPGIISEGSFHDYQPEVDRLLNLEYRKQEAWNIYYALAEYFQLPGTDDFGNITGLVRDSFLINKTNIYKNSPDYYLPVDSVLVEILETGDQYLTENNNSGFYYFDSLPPGDYSLKFSAENYFTDTVGVTVSQHQIKYLNYWIKADKTMPPQLVSYSPEGESPVPCFDPVSMSFNMNMDSATVVEAFSTNPPTSGTFTWDEDYLNLSYQPELPYDTSEIYTVTLDSTAEHQWGVRTGVISKFSFTTQNRNRYYIENSYPSNDQIDISPFLQFRLYFDAPLQNSSLIGAVSIQPPEGEPISTKGAKISAIDGKGHYYFSPAIDLEYNTSYSLEIDGSIQDENNIPLVDDQIIHFTTGSSPGVLIVLEELDDPANWSIDAVNSVNLNTTNSLLYKWTRLYISGTASTLVRYDFTDQNAEMIIRANTSVPLENNERAGLWIWGDMSLNEVFLEFDNDTESKLCSINFAGFRYCSAEIPSGATAIESVKIKRTANGMAGSDFYLDGLSQLNTTGISRELRKNISVYPNPVQGNTLHIEGLYEQAEYSLFSLKGKLLQKGRISSGKIILNENTKKEKTIVLNIVSNNRVMNLVLINE